MPPRWIDQASRDTGSGKAAQQANQFAAAQVIEHLKQRQKADAVTDFGSLPYRATVVSKKSTRHTDLLRSFGHDKCPHVGIRSDIMDDAGVALEIGRDGGCAMP